MTDITTPAAPVPDRSGAAANVLLGAVVAAALLVWWLATSESGQLLTAVGAHAEPVGKFLHELMHDGRHILGAPCH
jgi:hypothetical protein